MKKLLLLLVAFLTLISYAQKKDGFNFELNAGVRLMGEKSHLVNMNPGLHLDGGMGYMFNDKIGIKAQLSMDWFKTFLISDGSGIDRSGMGSVSLMAIFSITELADMKTNDFELKAFVGPGLSSINNPSWKEDRTANGVVFEDPLLKGNDDMGHFIVGLNPQYHLDRNWSINSNIYFLGLIKQDYTLDRFNNVAIDKGLTNIINISVGVNYRFGKTSSLVE